MKISASIQASNIYNLLDELENYKDSFDQLHVDITDGNFCLLYTSPSPRDATLSRMPSSA